MCGIYLPHLPGAEASLGDLKAPFQPLAVKEGWLHLDNPVTVLGPLGLEPPVFRTDGRLSLR